MSPWSHFNSNSTNNGVGQGDKGGNCHLDNFSKKNDFFYLHKNEIYTVNCVRWSSDDDGDLLLMERQTVDPIVYTSLNEIYIPVLGMYWQLTGR